MWVFPLLAALVAVAFTALLARQYLQRRRPYQALWAVALAMFAGASVVVFLGVLNGWSAGEFRVYWLLGAVLTVPFLAQGEVHLLVKDRRVAAGSAFAATGDSTGFSLTLAAGIAVMFYGFLRASRPGPTRPEPGSGHGPSLENASQR